jgi:transcriptional regulator with XRE-family HTH domain
MASRTVIEVARRAAGLSQSRLAARARTQQSSVSEYESRRKSPTLDVVERLVDAANAELTVKPMVFFERIDDPAGLSFVVPDRLMSVPFPKCFARVEVLKYVFPAEVTTEWTESTRIWDLSKEEERIDYYELLLRAGVGQMIADSVDALLLIQAWPKMSLPDAVREAWQPLIDEATESQDGPPYDPGDFSAWMANEIGLPWPPKRRRRRRRT